MARRALGAGASLVNDVSGLRYDPALAGGRRRNTAPALVADAHARPVRQHVRGGDVRRPGRGSGLRAEASHRRRRQSAGVPGERIIVDPGIGFAKRPEHSYGVLARLAGLAAAVERPLLVGPSRKSFMRARAGRPAGGRAGLGNGGRRHCARSSRARTSCASMPSPRWCRSSGWPKRSEGTAECSESGSAASH